MWFGDLVLFCFLVCGFKQSTLICIKILFLGKEKKKDYNSIHGTKAQVLTGLTLKDFSTLVCCSRIFEFGLWLPYVPGMGCSYKKNSAII